jgi:hypothetical protein
MITSLVYLRPVNVAAVRVRGPYSASAAQTGDLISDWLRTIGATCDVTPRYGLLLDDPRETSQMIAITRHASPATGFWPTSPGLQRQANPLWRMH